MDVGDRGAAVAVLGLTEAAWIAQAVSVAARLRLADLMVDGAKTVGELAEATVTHPPSLRRLLGALAGEGLFVEDDQGRFGLTPLGEPLRSDAADSVRALCALRGEPQWWAVWGELLHSVQTGEPAFRYVHGTDLPGFLAGHPDAAALYRAGMGELARTVTAAVVAAYDFGRFKTVVDVSGGQGALLAAILRAYPTVRGVLFDLPATVTQAGGLLAEAGVADRCTIIGGDFFEAVPEGGELYVLKSVIHDWDDEQALAILRSCRRAMDRSSRLLLVERVLPPGDAPPFASRMDLNMLVMRGGGRERTGAEYQRLGQCAGLALADVIPTGADISLIEGAPVDEAVGATELKRAPPV